MFTRVELSERTGYMAVGMLHLPERLACLPPMEYGADVESDWWDDDGSAEWGAMMARLVEGDEGVVIEARPKL